MSHRSIFPFRVVLLVFLILTSCDQPDECLSNLQFEIIEFADSKLDIAIIEFHEGKWVNVIQEQNNWGGRFSYKIAVDKDAKVLSVNGQIKKTTIRHLIDKELNVFLEEYSMRDEYPHVFFEIQTFGFPMESHKKELLALICKIHNIVDSLKKEKIMSDHDQKIMDVLLYERYVIYEYNQLFKDQK